MAKPRLGKFWNFDPWWPQFCSEPKNDRNDFEMIFRELSNAVFCFPLRRPGAEIMGGRSNAPPPSRRWKIQRGRGLTRVMPGEGAFRHPLRLTCKLFWFESGSNQSQMIFAWIMSLIESHFLLPLESLDELIYFFRKKTDWIISWIESIPKRCGVKSILKYIRRVFNGGLDSITDHSSSTQFFAACTHSIGPHSTTASWTPPACQHCATRAVHHGTNSSQLVFTSRSRSGPFHLWNFSVLCWDVLIALTRALMGLCIFHHLLGGVWTGSGQNIEKQNIESQNIERKISKAKYRNRKISKPQNIEVAKYRIAKYRIRKISKSQNIVSQNIEWQNIEYAKYRRTKYRMQNIERKISNAKYRSDIISKAKYRSGKISNAKYRSG